MKEIIGDDYPTYEDSVKLSLAEREIHSDNLKRLMQENFELRHRLSCIVDDIEFIERHIASYKKSRKWFKQPSLNEDGSAYADQAWHHVTNIQIACDLSDGSSLEWSSEVMTDAELDNLNRDLGEDPVFQGHLKHMESADEFSSKFKVKK